MLNDENPYPPKTIDVAGICCYVYETSSLEAWLMMHHLRQVIGVDDPPALCGSLAVVVTQLLNPGEIDFINEMSLTGGCPSLDKFIEIRGLVGVLDFHVEHSTDLPGWDGEGVAVILANPRWLRDGKLVPALSPIVRSESRSCRSRRQRRRRR